MNVLLISQCDKRALSESHRILDQFAERRGDRTWQTPITRDGLDTLRKLLRQSARKNTAVACHWIRGQDHSELLWIVGDASRFNSLGTVPTNLTRRDVLRRKDENDWHSAGVIGLLARMAALWHDFGKANVQFQRKLRSSQPLADAFRHEWVSLRLFQAFVGDDQDDVWLQRLQQLPTTQEARWQARLLADGSSPAASPPFAVLPPIARALAWLILTHHRLPAPPDSTSAELRFDRIWQALDVSWCYPGQEATEPARSDCWRFEHGLPDTSATWRKEAGELAARMLKRMASLRERDWLEDAFVAHLSRACLMMADHQFSSIVGDRSLRDPSYSVHANTDRDGNLKQQLDEHLVGVARYARQIVRALPLMDSGFARLARHRAFSQRTADERFRWQDRACDVAACLQTRTGEYGFFGINMASTGCGKTLANARILYALAHPQQGARFTVALGLRTLTLQTGDAYRERLHLGEDDLAVMVGSSAVRALHEQARESRVQSARGSDSAQPLIDEHVHVRYEGALPTGAFGDWFRRADPKLARLLNAPVLVCTIDHLMPACEATRGGHQIAPILRLLCSDLVLDEPDDFDLDDLPALTRLVHFAGLFGSRVLLSSATLAPAIVQGLFAAYCAGRRDFQRNRGRPGTPLNVCCAWFDEYRSASSQHADEAGFAQAHRDFVTKRLRHIATRQEVRRRAAILPLELTANREDGKRRELSRQVLMGACELHARHHLVDPASGKRVSLGLIRMANIDPLVGVARDLLAGAAPSGYRVHLVVYHSRFPLIVRSAIERRLDRLLARQDEQALLRDPELRMRLDADPAPDQVFVVLASPVAEVGRDHDYDWAVVEPSSMRSIIQLAGRVRRHRPPGACSEPNILLLDRNWRDIRSDSQRNAFERPGFESAAFRLRSHRLRDILRPDDYQPLTSAARIAVREILDPRGNLVDLEHERLRLRMLDLESGDARNVRLWWESAAALTAREQKRTPFRRSEPQQTFVLLPDEGSADGLAWKLREEDGRLTCVDLRIRRSSLKSGSQVSPWTFADYSALLTEQAERDGIEREEAAMRYGTVELPASRGDAQSAWVFHPVLGLQRDPTQ